MELEPRTTAPAHATGAVAFVPISAIDADATFRLREEGDVAALAASIGRLGHLVPIEVRPVAGRDGAVRYQVVAGFRRLAALRMLARERVLARIHGQLDDDDAWGIALAAALLGEPLAGPELEALRARVAGIPAARWAEELIDEALVRAPVDPEVRERFLEFLAQAPAAEGGEPGGEPGDEAAEAAPAPEPAAAAEAGQAGEEGGDVEVTPEELADDLAQRMFDVNQDLALAFESWADLPEEGRRMIVEQARYVAELLPLLGGGKR